MRNRERINRRAFMRSFAAAAAAAGLAPALARAQSPAAKRPNVIVIQPDQHRGTVMGCAGDSQAITPNLDRLAAEGARFANCASTGPVCCPFRGTMQTGLYPHTHGVVKNGIPLAQRFTTFAEIFAQAGYATGYIGKWHLDGGTPAKEGGPGLTEKSVGGFVPPERRRGWQEWNGYEKSHEYFEVWKYNEQGRKERVEGYDWEPTWQTDVCLDFFRRQRDEGKPGLYYLAYGPPHLPEQAPKKYLAMYPPEKFTLPPDVEANLGDDLKQALRKSMQSYYAQVTAIDVEIGRLLDGLKDLGIDENTIILYTSDHGDYLGSHQKSAAKLRGKGSPAAAAFRIPLIVRWPEQTPAGQVFEQLVSSVDLAPTLLDLAGLAVPEQMQGFSMAGWCRGEKGFERDAVYLGLGWNLPVPPVKKFDDPSKFDESDKSKWQIGSWWRAIWDGQYVYRPGKGGWLYNHHADPHEMHNLIDSPDYAAVRDRLGQRMIEIAQETGDPVLDELKAMLA
ncbi:MAG: Arylsulfatase [candidate division BRC1 bacterium ADurb.BinA364]|nr:MAG: Arylsulfatase [candidate division BRC1 bacterium ADurb.BinA364]